MDSSAFEFSVTPSHRCNSPWLVNFICEDVLRRHINVASYVVSQGENLYLPLPDRTSIFNCQTIRLRGLNFLHYDDIAQITYHLFRLDFPVGVCSEILENIDAAVTENLCGGDIKVRISRIKSKVFQRNEDARVDRYMERWLERNWSEPKPIPADESVIGSLQIVRYIEHEEINQGCVICMEDYEEGSKISRLPCEHVFHGDCIKKWLQINHQCPLCRFQMSH